MTNYTKKKKGIPISKKLGVFHFNPLFDAILGNIILFLNFLS